MQSAGRQYSRTKTSEVYLKRTLWRAMAHCIATGPQSAVFRTAASNSNSCFIVQRQLLIDFE